MKEEENGNRRSEPANFSALNRLRIGVPSVFHPWLKFFWIDFCLVYGCLGSQKDWGEDLRVS